jgi:cell division protein FtsA
MRFFHFKRRKKRLVDTIAAIDIGASKVSCSIARVEKNSGLLRVIGLGQQASLGLRSGIIVDMLAMESALLNAIHTAEQMAQETIREVYVNMPSAQTTSCLEEVAINVAGQEIDDADVRKLLTMACQKNKSSGNEILHSIPVHYAIDGSRGIRDPRGMFGNVLSALIHIITASAMPLRNLIACVERCHLNISGVISSVLAAGLAVLVEDERELGSIVVDLGAGGTSLGLFVEGNLIHTSFIPVGGHHVTNDIARGLSTPIVHAERLKALYGSAMVSASDEHETIIVHQVGERQQSKGTQISKSSLVRIIRPRIEETFELLQHRIHEKDMEDIAGQRAVLTGGGSQLLGVREISNVILNKHVRLGRPIHFHGLKEYTESPSFSCCAGLLRFAYLQQEEDFSQNKIKDSSKRIFGGIGLWLKENL